MSEIERTPLKVVVCQSGSVGQRQLVFLMYPSIHVLHLAGYLRHHVPQAQVSIVDGFAMSVAETIEAILRHEPDLVFLHGETPTATGMYEIADGLERRGTPKPMTVLFGEHTSALPSEAFTRCRCDAVMVGDPEPAAHSICLAVVAGGELAGIANLFYRAGDGEIVATPRSRKTRPLDELPAAARDLIDLSAYGGTFYKKSARDTSVLAGRGCAWACTFCGPAGRWAADAPAARHRSAKSLVDELQMLQNTYGIDDFLLIINTFNFNPHWSKEVCREIIDRGLRVNLKTHVRADRLNADLLALMREAGFWLVYIGIESANDRTLQGVKKELTVAQIETALAELHRAGIKAVGECMNCLFWEEDGRLVNEGFADAWRTLRFVRRMFRKGLLHAMYWAPMMPLPASPSYEVALRHGLIDDEVKGQWHLWFPVQRPIVRLPGMTNLKWYAIQWLGKAHQTYFILGSRLLDPSRRGLVLRRALQLLASTVGGAFRGLRNYTRSLRLAGPSR
jgi:radical SAM superfamily enzyme YgiQ (UPF0313 family)